jgi:hypothetical protein
MPTNRTPIRHPHRGRLSHEQEMVLQYGAEERWAEAFATEEEYRDAWIRNRDRLLAGYRNGRRPMAWWTLESPIAFPGYEQQQSVLYEANLLEPEERAALVEWWRAQFERAWAPHFFYCEGPGRILEGEPARKAHLRWADIPRELVREWTTQRRRRERIIGKLAKVPPAEPPTSDAVMGDSAGVAEDAKAAAGVGRGSVGRLRTENRATRDLFNPAV